MLYGSVKSTLAQGAPKGSDVATESNLESIEDNESQASTEASENSASSNTQTYMDSWVGKVKGYGSLQKSNAAGAPGASEVATSSNADQISSNEEQASTEESEASEAPANTYGSI